MENLVKGYISAYNQFDIDSMLEKLTDDIIFENHANGEVITRTTTKTQFAELVKQAAELFCERQQTISSTTADNDMVIVQSSYHAKLAHDLANGMKAGQTISLQGRSEYAFRDGKICFIKDFL